MKMNETFYDTSKGQDNSLVAELRPGVTIHKHRGEYFLRGSNYSTSMFDEIIELIDSNQLVFISVTGPPGKGKTWFAMRLMQLLDHKYHVTDVGEYKPESDPGQMVFDRRHLRYLIGPDSPLKQHQGLTLDESHFGIGARSWNSAVQKGLVNLLVAIRSKRLILCVIVLSMAQIDRYIRDFVVNYQFAIEAPGIATLYRRSFHKLTGEPTVRRLGVWHLPIPWGEDCPNPDCLGCEYLYEHLNDECITCDIDRARYERRKAAFLARQSDEEEEEEETQTKHKHSHSEIADMWHDFRYDLPIHRYRSTWAVNRSMIVDATHEIFTKLGIDQSLPINAKTGIANQIEKREWFKEVIRFHERIDEN